MKLALLSDKRATTYSFVVAFIGTLIPALATAFQPGIVMNQRNGSHQNEEIRFTSRCFACPPGFGVSEPCTVTEDTVCTRCEEGISYSDKHSAVESCYPCSHCGIGLYEAHPCTPFRDAFCDACATGHVFSADYAIKCRRSTPPKGGPLSIAGTQTQVNVIVNTGKGSSVGASSSALLPALEVLGFLILCLCIVFLLRAILGLLRKLRRDTNVGRHHVAENNKMSDLASRFLRWPRISSSLAAPYRELKEQPLTSEEMTAEDDLIYAPRQDPLPAMVTSQV